MVKITLLLKVIIEDMLERSFTNKYFIMFQKLYILKKRKL